MPNDLYERDIFCEAHQQVSQRKRIEDGGVEKGPKRASHSAQSKLLVEPGQFIEHGAPRAPMFGLVGHDIPE